MLALGEPIVLLAVFAATAILACACASAPLLLTSAASASVQQQLAAACPDAAWPSVTLASYPGAALPARDTAIPIAMTNAGLAPPSVSMTAGGTIAMDTQSGRSYVQLFYRDGAAGHLSILEAVDGEGLLLPASTAQSVGVRAGNTVTVLGSPVMVAGVYADLDRAPTTDFWCSYEPMFRFIPTISAPLPLLIATDAATVYRLTSDDPLADPSNFLRQPLTRSWASPIDTADLTRSEAREVISRQDAALRSLGDRAELLQLSGNARLAAIVTRTERIESGLLGPVVPIALTGGAIALVLVAAAGRFWADRRRREVRLLSARGVGPGWLGVKAAIEVLVPMLAGAVSGFLLARVLVVGLGPSDDLERTAETTAGWIVGAGLAAGIVLLAMSAGLRARNSAEPTLGSRAHWFARVPLELLPLAAAGFCWARGRAQDPVVVEAGVAKLNLLLIAFPLLLMVGAAPLVIRVLVAALPALRRRASGWSPANFLAANRVGVNRGITALVLGAVAVPVGVFGYAVTMTATTQQTLDAKAQVFVGSDLAVSTFDDAVSTPALDRISTRVLRYQDVTVGGRPAQVLGIDLDTFAGTAFWDSRFAGAPLGNLLDQLRASSEPIPALAVGAGAGEQELVFEPDQSVRVRVVATSEVFPGTHVDAPLVIVDADRLGQIAEGADLRTEFWTRGAGGPVLEQLAAQHVRVFTVFDRDRVFVVANFLGVSFTFAYLVALAAFIAVIGLAGLMLYVETRQRARTAAYVFARRMGLSRRQHAQAVRRELGVLLGAGVAVGAGLAAWAIASSYARFDVDPSRPPAQLLTLPLLPYGLALAGAIGVALAVSAYAQRVADRVDEAAVMRTAD